MAMDRRSKPPPLTPRTQKKKKKKLWRGLKQITKEMLLFRIKMWHELQNKIMLKKKKKAADVRRKSRCLFSLTAVGLLKQLYPRLNNWRWQWFQGAACITYCSNSVIHQIIILSNLLPFIFQREKANKLLFYNYITDPASSLDKQFLLFFSASFLSVSLPLCLTVFTVQTCLFIS